MKTLGRKILSIALITIMLVAHISSVGIHIGEVIAADMALNSQNSKTNHDNVEFDTFFVENEKGTHDAIKEVKGDNKILAKISVKNVGYLKDARIDFAGSNFEISSNVESDKVIKVENNSITLNQINANEDISIALPFEFKYEEKLNFNKLNAVSEAKLSATYIDGNGKEKPIKKDIKLGLKWTAQSEVEVTTTISKYIPYDVSGEKGLIVQMLLSEEVKENKLPIKESNIEIQTPEINGLKPIEAIVNSLEANMQSSYDEKTGKLLIRVNNEANGQNEITWKKDAKRNYEITYKYSEAAVEEEIKIVKDLKVNTILYSYDEKNIITEYKEEEELKDKIGEIVDYTLEVPEALSKGYMYANYNRDEKIETTYNEKVITNISLPELIDEITVNMASDRFVAEKVNAEANGYYKNIKIDRKQLIEKLGENGYLNIYSEGELIAKVKIETKEENNQKQLKVVLINNEEKEQEITEDNINIEVNLKELTIVTSKPITSGELSFELQKNIKGDEIYNKKQLSTINGVETEVTLQAKNEELLIVEKKDNKKIELKEPELQAELQLNNNNLSTIVPNENIEIRAILKTNSEYDKLYKNPQIVITLPEYIEKIDVKNIQLLFGGELHVTTGELSKNQIIVQLEGTQTGYSLNSIYGGTNLVITADITTNILTPGKNMPIIMEVISEEENTQEKITAQADINFIAPSGVVALNKVTNYVEGEELMALTQDESATLEVQTTAKEASEEIQIINNYDNKIENVEILGRTWNENTTNPTTGENLNNNLNMPMTSPINVEGQENVQIYYSANGNATKDLNNAQNGWVADENVEDYNEVKSYLIVLDKNDEMEKGEVAKFTYNMHIPENLNYSQNASAMYTVYFDNVQENQTLPDLVTSRVGTLTTGDAPQLQVNLRSYTAENSIVRQGEYIKFVATVKNTGTIDAENVQVKIVAPTDNTFYAFKFAKFDENGTAATKEEYIVSDESEKTITIGTIKANEEKTIEYDMQVNYYRLSSNMNEFQPESEEELDTSTSNTDTPTRPAELISTHTVKATASNVEGEVSSNEYRLKVEDGDVTVFVNRNSLYISTLVKGSTMAYAVEVKPIYANTVINDPIIRVEIPKSLKVIKTSYFNGWDKDHEIIENTATIDTQNNIVEFRIDKIQDLDDYVFNIITEVQGSEGEIVAKATVITNGNEHHGNILKNKLTSTDIDITQIEPENLYIKEEEEITFKYTIKNNIDASSKIVIKSLIPEGLEMVEGKMTIDGTDVYIGDYSDDILETDTVIQSNKTITLELTMKALDLPKGVEEKQITNYATISALGMNDKTSNVVTITIEKNPDIIKRIDNENEGGDEDDNSTGTNIISGIAWIDENNDGERNTTEETLQGMEVMLMNKNTNAIVAKTTTSLTGNYSFRNLENGEYIVLFVYDSETYELTQYQKAGVSQNKNSDAVAMDIEIEGTNKKVAVSDSILIQDSNARDIDIGLVKDKKSIMQLDKYISEITVAYGNTVKTYNYDDIKLAKVEIPKNEISNATVIVNYKIKVTNVGGISNYVKKIVDYIPSGMQFNSELNTDWSQSTNGDLYNSSLSNVEIKPGESKTVTLTLTRKVTANNMGIVNNTAEIYEVYNEKGIKTEYTPGNKTSGESDMSSADFVISVKTGNSIVYITIILVVIFATIAASIYIIRKNILVEI